MHRVLALLVLASVLSAHSPQIGPIGVGETWVDNGYPECIAFEKDVASSAV